MAQNLLGMATAADEDDGLVPTVGAGPRGSTARDGGRVRAATLGYTHVDELPDRVFRDLVLEQSGELVRGLEGQLLAELASDDCWPLRRWQRRPCPAACPPAWTSA